MSFVHGLRYRLRTMLLPHRARRELDEEMRHYLELDARQVAHAGGDPSFAARRFGNRTLWRERVTDGWAIPFIDEIIRDLRVALRSLRRRPAFAVAATLVWSIGIGGSSAILSMIPQVSGAGGGDPRFDVVLRLMAGAAFGLLAVACGSAARLISARALARRSELALRSALGAERSDVIRHVALENVLILGLSAGIGGAICAFMLRWIGEAFPSDLRRQLPHAFAPAVDWRGIALLTAIAGILGMVPTLVALRRLGWRVDLTRNAPWRARSRVGRGGLAMTALQLAATLVLVTAASLLVRSANRLAGADVGVRVDGARVARVKFPAEYDASTLRARYAAIAAHFEGTRDTTRHLELISFLPLSNRERMVWISISSSTATPPSRMYVREQHVSRGYFAAAEIALVRGRLFVTGDSGGVEPVAIINHALARRATVDLVGRKVKLRGVVRRIVGVVRDVRHDGADASVPNEIYVPFAQHPEHEVDLLASGVTPADSAAVATAIHTADPRVDIVRESTMAGIAKDHYAGHRVVAIVLTLFAGVAALLTTLGIAGLVAQHAEQHRREIGVRLALGAGTRELVLGALTQVAAMEAAGVILGLFAASAVERAIHSATFGIVLGSPRNFVTTLLAATVLTAAPLIQVLWMAMRFDPMRVLRSDD